MVKLVPIAQQMLDLALHQAALPAVAEEAVEEAVEEALAMFAIKIGNVAAGLTA